MIATSSTRSTSEISASRSAGVRDGLNAEVIYWTHRHSRRSALRSGLQEHLERPVLLLLEDLVRVRGVLERQVVRGEVVDAERVLVAAEQRQDVVDPAPDVRLPHPQV